MAASVDFVRDVRPIFKQHCYDCHGADAQKSGLRLDVKSVALRGGDKHGPDIVPGKPGESPLVRFLQTDDEKTRMPQEADRLSENEIETLTRWVKEGAPWPDGVDEVVLEDKRDHWAFKPLALAPGAHSIDAFITATLRAKGLSMSPAADRRTWLRRVTFDLIGLPPTPEQMNVFLNDQRPDAHARVVDSLLASPRYGERWGQHWLDVVRYADTHGFEVNTERPNAWPYRDYVIKAFNADTPYDRFVREQIVGDRMSQDAATGFLVTASVLLPGQIGKDEPSKRLARQDSLDEIVANIGQSFLGLSIGCARCHDHKFDPISSRDYYAMQAFVAGVEYQDREMRTPEADAAREAVAQYRARLEAIDTELQAYAPRARPGLSPAALTQAKLNTESFPAREARFVRFTMHDANLHPSLGLIEPCIDEFEIFTDEPQPRNVALASLGARATASGSRHSASHQLAFVNDGRYGNSRSWMSDTRGQGWLQIELPEPMRISKVVWGRDREGKYQDRLATAYTLEAGLAIDELQTLAQTSVLRRSVDARKNVDRFVPVRTSRLRFTIRETNSLQPCIDELEVFNIAGENIALAEKGTTATCSSERNDRHTLMCINDGKYGDPQGWISAEMGTGWVELAFPQAATIDRVVWARDRTAKHKDRLAIDYLIEVADADGNWLAVADASDRRVYDPKHISAVLPSFAGLRADEREQAKGLQDERQRLEEQIKQAEKSQKAFAGVFRSPDEIYLLNRGDPEQPGEAVPPAVLSALDDIRLSPTTPEHERREILAEWIVRPDHPLTARVMVNRIWQGHFGMGLVDTPSDFGRLGTQPSHPELLDWLAHTFMASGWSMKQLHRRIVLSDTYGQSTEAKAQAMALDANVRLLWRFPFRRLEAETIRDSMLAVSGQLNLKMYGPGYNLFDKRGGLTGFKPVESFTGEGLRRMVYAHKVRRETEAVFGAFDCPDAGQSTARRRQSTTPIQALNLFNSRFTLDAAEALAARVTKDAGADIARQVARCYELALNRAPSSEELREAVTAVRVFGLPVLCRVIFNTNEFLFLP